MTSIVYLIRHGQTEWNRLEKLQGHSDIELNDLGRAQAQALSQFTQDLKVDAVIASDLLRAVQTAQIAFPHFSSITTDPRLREVHLGSAEGQNRNQLESVFGPEMIRAWFSTDPEDMTQRFPGGESRAEALARMQASLKDHLQQFSNGTKPVRLAFVTHGLIMRTLTQNIVGEYRPEFRAPNCARFEFEYHHPTESMKLLTMVRL